MFRLAVFALALLAVEFAAFAEFTGRCVAVLGAADTLIIERDGEATVVRLSGVACPVKGQDFNLEAAKFVRDLALDKLVEVKERGIDSRETLLAFVQVDGKDLSEEILKAGYGWCNAKGVVILEFSELESQAKAERLGLWSKPSPTPPWDFRPENCLPKLDIADFGFSYAGSPIKPAQFDALFKALGKYWHFDKAGNAYNLQDGAGVKRLEGFWGCSVDGFGFIKGTVSSVVDGDRIMLAASGLSAPLISVKGLKTDGLRPGSRYECAALCLGLYSLAKLGKSDESVPEFLQLSPFDRERFKDLLDSGRRLYVYRKFNRLVSPGRSAEFARCDDCSGWGKMANPDRKRIDPVVCPGCGGKGSVKLCSSEEAVYEEELRQVDAIDVIK